MTTPDITSKRIQCQNDGEYFRALAELERDGYLVSMVKIVGNTGYDITAHLKPELTRPDFPP